MHSGGGGPTRGVTLGVLTAVLTVTGHGAGGGQLPDLAVLAVLLVPLCSLLATVARRCTSLAAVLAVLGSGQLALHLLITALEPHAHSPEPGASMVVAHVVVTVVAALLHRHADAALAAVARAWRRVLPAVAPAAGPVRVAGARTRYESPARPLPGVLVGTATRRGPPAAG